MRHVTIFPIKEFSSARTPFYFYDIRLLKDTLEAIRAEIPADDAVFHVHYAIKANANPGLLAVIRDYGLGADCVSGAEVQAAIEQGFPAEKIVFAGVGKRVDEIELALEAGIGCFNVESVPELELIDRLAAGKGCIAKVAIRVNPNIDAHTHHYITTGLAENKFGINFDQLNDVVDLCMRLPNIELIGLHFHIGSQILDMEPYKLLCVKINRLQDDFMARGISLSSINVGGGLGIDYENPDQHPVPDFNGYFRVFRENLKLRPGQTVHFELGRSVVAQCGSLITQVLYVKEGISKNFVIVDAGMTDLIRPALYGAHHLIQNISACGPAEHVYDVVGPICESSDCFGKNERLPLTHAGDYIALRSAGAYGECMASRYNLRSLPGSMLWEE